MHISVLLATGGQPRGYTVSSYARFPGTYLVMAVVTGTFAFLEGLTLVGVLVGLLIACRLGLSRPRSRWILETETGRMAQWGIRPGRRLAWAES